MKTDIHPNYQTAQVSCVCGETFETRTTVGDIKLEICSNCHPFFTGRQVVLDTAGRIDKFNRRFERSKTMRAKKKETATAAREETAETAEAVAADTTASEATAGEAPAGTADTATAAE